MEGLCWQHWSAGKPFPPDAVHGGRDIDGSAIYVGRAHHHGDLLPAKVIPAKRVAYVAWGGREISMSTCEVLCRYLWSIRSMRWVPASQGVVPKSALPIGHTANGEILYAGRVHHKGSHTVGKIHPSHRTCYIPFDGKEISNSSYEVLVYSR